MQNNEIILKKLDQVGELLSELEKLLNRTPDDFKNDIVAIRASERNYQLIVDLASDINTHILIDIGKETPDTYRQSFSDMGKEKIIPKELAEKLVMSAKLRNILVHEYDFEEDYERFYLSAKELAPFYREYVKLIYEYARKK